MSSRPILGIGATPSKEPGNFAAPARVPTAMGRARRRRRAAPRALALGFSLGKAQTTETEIAFAFLEASSHAPWPDVALPDEIEQKLIERIAQRDERAFSELVRLYQRRVFALVFRMLQNRAEAEELSQDVFVQVFKAIGTFRGDSKLSTWIYRIAINLCKNRVKYLKVRHSDEQDAVEDIAERVPLAEARNANVGQVDRPDDMMAGKQVEYIVQRAIAQLEPGFRECLVLRDVEELSYEEIEQITGLAAGTVKSRIFRARQMLREIVERELGEKIG